MINYQIKREYFTIFTSRVSVALTLYSSESFVFDSCRMQLLTICAFMSLRLVSLCVNKLCKVLMKQK